MPNASSLSPETRKDIFSYLNSRDCPLWVNYLTVLGLGYPLYTQYIKNHLNEVVFICLVIGVNIGMIIMKEYIKEAKCNAQR